MSDPFIAAAVLEGVPSSYQSTRDSIDAVLRDRGLRKSTPEHTARSLLLGAWASASLEGSSFDVEELAEGKGDATAQAAVRLSTQLLGLLPMWRTSPVQALARIHAIAAAGSVSPDELGRPVNPAGVQRLQNLGEMLKQKTEAPALVVAALTHAEIIAAGAFISHNSVVARAAERLMFVDRGIDPASVTVPEVGHIMDSPGYFALLKAYETQATGVHQWLLWCADSYARAAEASPLHKGLG